MQTEPVHPDRIATAARSALPAADEVRRRKPRWLEWLTRRRAIAAARREEPARAGRRALVSRAGSATRAGDRLLDPADGAAPQPELALCLYREAAQCLLAAAFGAEQPLAEQLARASTALQPLGLPPPSAEVAQALAEDGFAFAARPDRELRARDVQRFCGALLEQLERADAELLRLQLERAVRIGALVLAAAGLATLCALAIVDVWRGPDLAHNRPWRASSKYDTCEPARRWCGGSRTAIFFHTKDDPEPWLEIDLQSVQQVSRIYVKNRSDYGPERAVPLRVEVSSDGKRYWPVAHRLKTFNEWTASFSPQKARYVRLTVERQSYLHLERISVWR